MNVKLGEILCPLQLIEKFRNEYLFFTVMEFKAL